jgi:hypothetical protein
MDLKDWLTSIYSSKKDLLKELDNANQYPAFIINRMLSGNIDTALFANELNERYTMDKDMQYKFLLYAIPSKKRFSPYMKKSKLQDLGVIKQYYGYNTEKALDALKILTNDHIEYIKKKLNTGGI